MLKNLTFILKENDKNIIHDKEVSTFGYKFTFRGEWYGSYIVINKPALTPKDIMECLESICPQIEQLLEELTTNTE